MSIRIYKIKTCAGDYVQEEGEDMLVSPVSKWEAIEISITAEPMDTVAVAVKFKLDHKRRDRNPLPAVYSNYIALSKGKGYDISKWTMDNVLDLWDYVYMFDGDIDDNFVEEVKEMLD